jgi:aminopeptidase N
MRVLSPLTRAAIIFLVTIAANAQTTRYTVKLTPDFDHQLLRGEEDIEFQHAVGISEWNKQAGLQIIAAESGGGDVELGTESVKVRSRAAGQQKVHFSYQAAPGRGLDWIAGGTGLVTEFYCEAWMVCDNRPDERATLRLEIILPVAGGMRPVAPGRLTNQWRDTSGAHFVFEEKEPVQTYLFSFGVAKLELSRDGNLSVYAKSAGHTVALRQTADAYEFLRGRATVDLRIAPYVQVFMPTGGLGQEAAGLALMNEDYLSRLDTKDDILLMTHELAHQWWGVLVGIRSWSDFWLNEGMADFMADAYLEQFAGRAAYVKQMDLARKGMEELREQGKDRPLHWEQWKDAHEALGRVPYVKGALFLDRLRSELGESAFWQGIALYSSRNARRLVDSRDFQHAMEEASRRDLGPLFAEGVYR